MGEGVDAIDHGFGADELTIGSIGDALAWHVDAGHGVDDPDLLARGGATIGEAVAHEGGNIAEDC